MVSLATFETTTTESESESESELTLELELDEDEDAEDSRIVSPARRTLRPSLDDK